MRKFLLFTAVFALTSGTIAHQNKAHALLGGGGISSAGIISAINNMRTQINNTLNSNHSDAENTRDQSRDDIIDNQNEVRDNLIEDNQLQSQQDATIGLANTGATVRAMSAQSQNEAITAKNVVRAESALSLANAGDQNCVIGSGGASYGAVQAASEAVAESATAELMNIVNGGASLTANGAVDFKRQLFEQRLQLCDPAGFGGADVNCTGSGNQHLNIATLLNSNGFLPGGIEDRNLEYFKMLMFVRLHESLNPDLMESPDTNIRNLMIESDQLKAEMSVGGAIFNKVEGYRTKFGGVSVINSARDRLQESGFGADMIDKLTAGGVSSHALLKTLTAGSFNPKFLLQKVTAPERDLLANIFAEMALNNVIQFRQLELLESIAVAQGIAVVTSRDAALNALNAKITAANNNRQ